MPEAGDGFEGAVGVTESPGLNGVTDGAESPYAFDARCHEAIQAGGGPTYTFDQTDPYGAAVSWCSNIYIMVEALQAAGSDLTEESYLEAVQAIEAVPGPGGNVFTGLPSGRDHAATDLFFSQSWELGCACWNQVAGPTQVSVLE